jgi:hypothetical protein
VSVTVCHVLRLPDKTALFSAPMAPHTTINTRQIAHPKIRSSYFIFSLRMNKKITLRYVIRQRPGFPADFQSRRSRDGGARHGVSFVFVERKWFFRALSGV